MLAVVVVVVVVLMLLLRRWQRRQQWKHIKSFIYIPLLFARCG